MLDQNPIIDGDFQATADMAMTLHFYKAEE